MSEPSSPFTDASQKRVDVHLLSLSQLQKLADRGSRRARAELEKRLLASGEPSRPADLPPPPPKPAPTPRAAPGAAPPSAPSAAKPRAAASRPAPRPAPAPGAAASGAAADAGNASSKEVLLQQLEMIARQEREQDNATGAARLVGMALIGWGALVLMGGLVTLGYRAGGGLYYVFCALGIAAVGWLLMRCSRLAMALHPALIMVALVWAWAAGGPVKSVLAALIQAAPVWFAVLWIAAPQVREPLE